MKASKTAIGFLVLAALSASGFAQKTPYNIEHFGAVGDSVTLCTDAINKSIETCSSNGGGLVIIPAGTFVSGTIQMRNNVELHLQTDATLLASDHQEDFPRQSQPAFRSQKDPGGWFSLIYAEKASNIAITGHGTIDGNGYRQKPRGKDDEGDKDGRTRNILFISCDHIRIEGIRMINSGIWNQHYLDCEDIIIDRTEVYNHSNWNNDAIDLDCCRRVTLSNSIFDTDDDGITLKSTGAKPCEDIVITNCVVSSFCNAIKAGTESTGGFRNITVSNCVIKPSREPVLINGCLEGITGISLEIVDGGIMESISINNVVIEGTQCPLFIRLGNRARKHTALAPEPPLGKMRNINISNITAYHTGNFSNSITAIPGSYIENVTLNNIQLFNTGGLKTGEYIALADGVKEDEKGYPQPTVWGNLPSSVWFIRHVKNLIMNNLIFGSETIDPRIPIIAIDVKNISIKNSIYTGNSAAASYVFLNHVEGYEIEEPLGWKKQH
ncbi:MAG: Exo-poly-alpha-D-galacturonosidase [Candidatus Ordinivivax streblomastigis]|uniref:Exo-poly-alpha-D-galacturonosidase n=1 Tax=Candidatus Ordinivivax streblomastigis TaxID=2540710 RepID=A0A5M8NSI6_9BACT|nr:MAG: Exo-poly-alpha-D-galacturonosidase [Candidatus Ordinivivax streblomastigis]